MNGPCYPNSFKLIRQLKEQADAAGRTSEWIDDNLNLVHGDADLSATVSDHAWVEESGVVYDASVTPVFECPVKDYYDHYKVRVRARYTHDEAIKLHARVAQLDSPDPQGAPGPWDSEARNRHGLLPLPGFEATEESKTNKTSLLTPDPPPVPAVLTTTASTRYRSLAPQTGVRGL